MNIKKIVSVLIIFIILLTASTIIVSQLKPQMHKMILLEKIIYKRSTK